MSSEPPFDRLGRREQLDDDPRRVRLHGGETVFSLAHHHLGEWRRWIEIVDANELADPLDLQGRDHDASPSFIASEGDDITEDTDVHLVLLGATPEFRGDATITVEDVDDGVFELRLTAPGDDKPGEHLRITEDEFFDGEDHLSRRFTLYSHRRRHFLFFECDLDALLVMWTAREMTVRLESDAQNRRLTVPQPQLGAARGEL